ncbi:MAG: 6-phosphogluconolactonase [Caldilineales bacterium]|nr:6-phosphogluconolactonase [Caldilineales bacterium]MDW8318773.1 6-phosphogluconolactonase [Anaerolineae bacterium]
MSEVVVKPTAEAVAAEAAERLVQAAQAAVARRGRFRVALAGGNTPMALYRLLVAEPYRQRMPWPQAEVFWGDERHLPPGDPGRNDTAVLPLLAEAGVPPAQIHPAPYIPDNPDASARAYEVALRRGWDAGEPLLDAALLGLGTDGHTASLFPGTPALEETARLVVANRAAYEDRHPERITLTLPALAETGLILFLVTGAAKREAVRRALAGPEDPPLPAQRVRSRFGPVVWLLDEAAAP